MVINVFKTNNNTSYSVISCTEENRTKGKIRIGSNPEKQMQLRSRNKYNTILIKNNTVKTVNLSLREK